MSKSKRLGVTLPKSLVLLSFLAAFVDQYLWKQIFPLPSQVSRYQTGIIKILQVCKIPSLWRQLHASSNICAHSVTWLSVKGLCKPDVIPSLLLFQAKPDNNLQQYLFRKERDNMGLIYTSTVSWPRNGSMRETKTKIWQKRNVSDWKKIKNDKLPIYLRILLEHKRLWRKEHCNALILKGTISLHISQCPCWTLAQNILKLCAYNTVLAIIFKAFRPADMTAERKWLQSWQRSSFLFCNYCNEKQL